MPRQAELDHLGHHLAAVRISIVPGHRKRVDDIRTALDGAPVDEQPLEEWVRTALGSLQANNVKVWAERVLAWLADNPEDDSAIYLRLHVAIEDEFN